MHIKNHFLLGLLLATFLWFTQKTDLKDLILLVQSTVLIDMDHFIIYIRQKKRFSLGHYIKEQRHYLKLQKPRFYMFHKIEIVLLLFLLSSFLPVLKFVSIGVAFHIFLDMLIYVRHHRSLRRMRTYSYLHDIYCGIRRVPAY